MTQEAEMAARGRLATEYGEVKKKKATLEAEATRIGKILQEIGRLLEHNPEKVVFQGQERYGVAVDVQKIYYPIDKDAAALPILVQDIRQTVKEMQTMGRQLKDLGVLDDIPQ